MFLNSHNVESSDVDIFSPPALCTLLLECADTGSGQLCSSAAWHQWGQLALLTVS